MPSLVQGIVYNTISYGPVMYVGDCESERSPRGVCHRFTTVRGRRKYISPEELEFFLERRNESR